MSSNAVAKEEAVLDYLPNMQGTPLKGDILGAIMNHPTIVTGEFKTTEELMRCAACCLEAVAYRLKGHGMPNGWVKMTIADFQHDLQYKKAGREKISHALDLLEAIGFLESKYYFARVRIWHIDRFQVNAALKALEKRLKEVKQAKQSQGSTLLWEGRVLPYTPRNKSRQSPPRPEESDPPSLQQEEEASAAEDVPDENRPFFEPGQNAESRRLKSQKPAFENTETAFSTSRESAENPDEKRDMTPIVPLDGIQHEDQTEGIGAKSSFQSRKSQGTRRRTTTDKKPSREHKNAGRQSPVPSDETSAKQSTREKKKRAGSIFQEELPAMPPPDATWTVETFFAVMDALSGRPLDEGLKRHKWEQAEKHVGRWTRHESELMFLYLRDADPWWVRWQRQDPTHQVNAMHVLENFEWKWPKCKAYYLKSGMYAELNGELVPVEVYNAWWEETLATMQSTRQAFSESELQVQAGGDRGPIGEEPQVEVVPEAERFGLPMTQAQAEELAERIPVESPEVAVLRVRPEEPESAIYVIEVRLETHPEPLLVGSVEEYEEYLEQRKAASSGEELTGSSGADPQISQSENIAGGESALVLVQQVCTPESAGMSEDEATRLRDAIQLVIRSLPQPMRRRVPVIALKLPTPDGWMVKLQEIAGRQRVASFWSQQEWEALEGRLRTIDDAFQPQGEEHDDPGSPC